MNPEFTTYGATEKSFDSSNSSINPAFNVPLNSPSGINAVPTTDDAKFGNVGPGTQHPYGTTSDKAQGGSGTTVP